jgi:hypothetical protein
MSGSASTSLESEAATPRLVAAGEGSVVIAGPKRRLKPRAATPVPPPAQPAPAQPAQRASFLGFAAAAVSRLGRAATNAGGGAGSDAGYSLI